jgi:signal peptide peptidase SppA
MDVQARQSASARMAMRLFAKPLMVEPTRLNIMVNSMGTGDMQPAGNPSYRLTQDGIAVIGIDGLLVYRSNWLSELSSITTYGRIQESLDRAMADPSVRGVLLEIDSPGGEINGCFDLSDGIFQARTQKPIYGVAADDAYSAAYALLSACSKAFVSRTSGVGSIGVVAMHVDQSAADKAEGLKYTFISSGQNKTDGNSHQPLTPGATQSVQQECNRLANMFAGSVAKYRGISAQSLLAMGGACFFGDKAVGSKLADGVGTPQDAMAALRSKIASSASPAYDQGRLSGASPSRDNHGWAAIFSRGRSR